MNFVQLLKFALGGLWRQKVRTALTLVGVTVGTCALAFSVSLGLGLRAFIDTEFKGRDDFWRIVVRADEAPPDESTIPSEKIAVQGSMSDERRARIREALVDRYQHARSSRPATRLLTPDKLDAIAHIPGVAEIRTYRTGDGRVWIDSSETPASALCVSGRLDDLAPRLLAGRLPSAPNAEEIVVSEYALYQLGIRDDADLERAVGRTVKLDVGGVKQSQATTMARAMLGPLPAGELTRGQVQVLEKIAAALPKKLSAFDLSIAEQLELQKLLTPPAEPSEERQGESGKTASGTFRICGVVSRLTRDERKKTTPLDSWELTQGEVFLPPTTGDKLFGKLPWQKEGGFYSADVRVIPGSELPAIVSQIEAQGFRAHSGAKWFAAAKREVTLIAAGLNLFAFIALFVASVGITNTLVTSVVERTGEIGILRAVGATRGQVMGLFLTEGALIGCAGAVFGLALAFGLTIWADKWVQTLIAGQMDGHKMLSTTIFVFPWWLWAGSVCFAVAVTTLAALYPARRASQIHPIEALRYG
ncbi:ABC transporter permease YtrF precursor [Gemmata sp. SH-PL17]|uniref:ABC transporter permease n=1 Tax=Gemmata sp. SH-PL17 TaxID=1630693 RepID=UPI00078D49C2|nr:ABC transporter permease [Gemmata sp. SH-PL17]AMV23819.1 ABC transporter permease YtrF precursor [Gemmata sp. SH-PL17]